MPEPRWIVVASSDMVFASSTARLAERHRDGHYVMRSEGRYGDVSRVVEELNRKGLSVE